MKRGKKETKNVVDVQEEVTEPVTEEIKEEVTEPVTEEIKEEVTEPVTEEQPEQITEEIKEEIIEPVIVYNGRVDNCFKLNLRRKPNKNSEVISILDKGQIVVILDQVNDFYKVEVDGLIGFCMKSYIEII